MSQPFLTVQDCPRCGGRINIISCGFQSCGCGILPTKIIGSVEERGIRNALSDQFRLSAYLKLACSKAGTDKLSRLLSTLSLNTAYKLFGKGSIHEAETALTASHISCQENSLIIPNLIDGEIVSGVWQLNGEKTSYLEVLPGGLAFSFTLKEPSRFTRQLFVFQNLRKAVELLLELYSRYGVFVPIVAHPNLRILENINWLPKKEIVLVVDEIRPQELRPLLPLRPRVIHVDSCVQYERSLYKLHYFYNKAEFLEDILSEHIAVTSKHGILITNNKWYYTPSGALALNADVHIEKIKHYRSGRLYSGIIRFSGKNIKFVVSEKNAYKKLRKLALKHGMNLYCAQKIRNTLLDIASVKSQPETEEILRLGLQRNHTILLPNLIITPKEIIPEISAFGSRLPARNLRWIPEPFFHLYHYYKDDRGTISQFTALSSVLLLLGYSLVHKNENAALFLLTDSLDSVLYILECCGISFAHPKSNYDIWPSIYPQPESLLIGPKKLLPITYGDYKYLALVMLHYKTIVANISSVFIPLIPEDTLQHAFVIGLRRLLETTRAKRWRGRKDINKELLAAIRRCVVPNELVSQHVAKRIRFQFTTRKRKALALLVGRLLDEGILNHKQLRAANTAKYEISLPYLNELLMTIGLPQAIPVRDQEECAVVDRYDVNCAINNPQGLLSGLWLAAEK